MPNYRLVVEYAGEAFAGWQIQAGGERTVQGCLAEAVARVTGERVTVTGSGRTDAGVHAEAQVASLALEAAMEPTKLQRALNGVLPREMAVRAAYEVDGAFDALRSAQGADSASLMWQQHGDNTDLLLSGPIGLGATRIHSDGKHLDINRGGELQRIDISSPDAIARATGWDLPLAALRHWLKGAPAPDLAIQSLDLDPKQGLLLHLRQADWDIHYQHYREFDGLRLPTRLHIKRGSTEARILIAQWQLPPDR